MKVYHVWFFFDLDFSNSQAGEMLRALARRQQEQSIGKPTGAQYDPAVYGTGQASWSAPGQFNLPVSEASYDYIETNAAGPSGRSQSSPYNLPVSEINLARQMLQSSGNRSFEQPMRGTVQFGQQPLTPSMPSPNAQQMTSQNNVQQKMLSFQQQLNQQRQSDPQFPYY